MASLPDDVETDADQSNPGDGSHLHLRTEDSFPVARQGISFESITANLQALQLETKEQIEMLQKSNEELAVRFKKTLEEKEIWMTRCQRMETMLTAATDGRGDENMAGEAGDGEKHLENFLQENAFLKAECDKLREQLLRAQAGVIATNGGSYSNSGAEKDMANSQDSRGSMQPTEEGSKSQHEMVLATQVSQDSPDGPGHTVEVDGYAVSQQPPSASLSTRRGVEPPMLTKAPSLQPTGNAQPRSDSKASPISPEDMGDKPPDDDMLQYCATNLKHTEYKIVLRKAGLPDNRIGDIEHRYPRDAQECRFQTLKEWCKKLGRRATLRVLVHTMLEMELTQTAEGFCEEFKLNFLIVEYEQLHPEEPPTPATPGGGLEEDGALAAPERNIEPLEKIIAPLMKNPGAYEEDFLPVIENVIFTKEQVESFVKDQKWKDKGHYFFQELNVLENNPTLHNVLTCWAMAVLSIYDSNPKYNKVDKRKHVWKMMKSLRKRAKEVFEKFKEDELFEGGVLGLDATKEKKMVNQLNFNHHNKMKLLLQQARDDGRDWRGVASEIPNVDQRIIQNWTQKGHDVATEDTLKTFGTSCKGTVQKLYEVLVNLDRPDVAQVLED